MQPIIDNLSCLAFNTYLAILSHEQAHEEANAPAAELASNARSDARDMRRVRRLPREPVDNLLAPREPLALDAPPSRTTERRWLDEARTFVRARSAPDERAAT